MKPAGKDGGNGEKKEKKPSIKQLLGLDDKTDASKAKYLAIRVSVAVLVLLSMISHGSKTWTHFHFWNVPCILENGPREVHKCT